MTNLPQKQSKSERNHKDREVKILEVEFAKNLSLEPRHQKLDR